MNAMIAPSKEMAWRNPSGVRSQPCADAGGGTLASSPAGSAASRRRRCRSRERSQINSLAVATEWRRGTPPHQPARTPAFRFATTRSQPQSSPQAPAGSLPRYGSRHLHSWSSSRRRYAWQRRLPSGAAEPAGSDHSSARSGEKKARSRRVAIHQFVLCIHRHATQGRRLTSLTSFIVGYCGNWRASRHLSLTLLDVLSRTVSETRKSSAVA